MQDGVKVGYRFSFPAGKTIGNIRRNMRKVARQLGYEPEKLYRPDALNLPELLTKQETRRWMDNA